jgi:hypothetical protein
MKDGGVPDVEPIQCSPKRGALNQAAAGIGNDQLNAFETAVDQMAKKRRPARLVFLGALTDAQDLPKSFRMTALATKRETLRTSPATCAS